MAIADKTHRISVVLLCCFFLTSCQEEELTKLNNDPLPFVAAVINWTGHNPFICSTGETLIFSVTANNNTQEFKLPPDSSVSYFEEGVDEGDVIRVVVMDENRDMIHTRTKNYYPSNPELPGDGDSNTPAIKVCQIDELELLGF